MTCLFSCNYLYTELQLVVLYVFICILNRDCPLSCKCLYKELQLVFFYVLICILNCDCPLSCNYLHTELQLVFCTFNCILSCNWPSFLLLFAYKIEFFCMYIVFILHCNWSLLQLFAFRIVIGGNGILPVNTPFYLKLQHNSFAAVAWSHLSTRNNGSKQVQKATFKTVLQVLTLLKTFWNTRTQMNEEVSVFMQITWQQKHAELFSCMLPVTLFCPSVSTETPRVLFISFIISHQLLSAIDSGNRK